MISYAQNFEDVILNRALSHVSNGFYIDVGASDPLELSVTKAFYTKGWRGINIEPLESCFKALVIDRPEDINLNIAIADYDGMLELFGVRAPNASFNGLSTTNRDYALTHSQAGFELESISVPCYQLKTILSQHKFTEVHFMKIDVEGAEKQVLEGLFLTNVRPWVILAESTKPLSTVDFSFEWENIILGNEYEFVYFDGLNKFYLAKEHIDLKKDFQVPLNVFDDFITYQHWLNGQKLEEKERQLEEKERQVMQLKKRKKIIQFFRSLF